MTFNNINNGDPLDATKAMENWRHTNYGSPLLPVNSSGVAVDDTIDLGSSSAGFKDGFFTGELKADAQPYLFLTDGNRGTNGNIINFLTSENTGGFTVSSGKVTPPSAGLYLITIRGDFVVVDAGLQSYLYFKKYNSSDALLFNHAMASAETNGTDYTISDSGSIVLRFDAGDYLFASYGETSGGSYVQNVIMSFYKMV
jgi:hypothetical protein